MTGSGSILHEDLSFHLVKLGTGESDKLGTKDQAMLDLRLDGYILIWWIYRPLEVPVVRESSDGDRQHIQEDGKSKLNFGLCCTQRKKETNRRRLASVRRESNPELPLQMSNELRKIARACTLHNVLLFPRGLRNIVVRVFKGREKPPLESYLQFPSAKPNWSNWGSLSKMELRWPGEQGEEILYLKTRSHGKLTENHGVPREVTWSHMNFPCSRNPEAPRAASVSERQCGAGGLGIHRVCAELGFAPKAGCLFLFKSDPPGPNAHVNRTCSSDRPKGMKHGVPTP
ncbi:hypothetical protein B0H14DRAFT_2622040 [Mycena olivaceomarginata]|nr:hypothetical protein B0H14DRAFT_2622040 [Mycena olivaceomarginata]